jgi:hypothetical protein
MTKNRFLRLVAESLLKDHRGTPSQREESLSLEIDKRNFQFEKLRRSLSFLDQDFSPEVSDNTTRCNGQGCWEWEEWGTCKHSWRVVRSSRLKIVSGSLFKERSINLITKSGKVIDLVKEEGVALSDLISIEIDWDTQISEIKH